MQDVTEQTTAETADPAVARSNERAPEKDARKPLAPSELQELIDLQKNIDLHMRHSTGALGRLRRFFRDTGERFAQFLDSRVVIVVAACLSILVLGWFVYTLYERAGTVSSSTPGESAPAPAPAGAGVPRELTPVEDPFAPSFSGDSKADPSAAMAEDSFLLVVGSFRDEGNAERIAQSLREHQYEVRTALTNGLYVVLMGPFATRSLAEDTARMVSETADVAPRVIPGTLP